MTGVTGSPWYTNHYFDAAGIPLVCQQKVEDFWALVAVGMNNDVDIVVQGTLLLIDEETGVIDSADVLSDIALSGSNADDVLPPGTQGLVTWRTGTYAYGRPVAGRTFIPGFTEGNSLDGSPSGSTVSAMNAAAAAMISPDPDAQFGIWTRPRYTDTRPPLLNRAGLFSPAVAGSGLTEWSSLRTRRKQG
uniref:Uncharacterized protein n=1 Tax=uncultured prokaryote TaxID=198431 RepID=A0A0H5Q7N0_9ZZZZ|nr:hypothetical protein [uncultured prokaryote]